MCFCSQVISKLSKGLIPQLHWLGTVAIIPPFIALKLFLHQYHHQGYHELVFLTDTIHNFLDSKY